MDGESSMPTNRAQSSDIFPKPSRVARRAATSLGAQCPTRVELKPSTIRPRSANTGRSALRSIAAMVGAVGQNGQTLNRIAIVLNAVRGRSQDLPRDRSRLRAEDLQYLPSGFDLTIPRFTQDNVISKGQKTRAQVLREPVTVNGKQIRDDGYQLRQLDELCCIPFYSGRD